MSGERIPNEGPAVVASCCFRGCKVSGAELVECSSDKCNKKGHFSCYQGNVLMKHNLEPISGGRIACTKKCFEQVMKALSGGGEDSEGGRKGNWTRDGKNGPDDPNTSMSILIKWWMEEGNYSKFCGKNNDGVKKIQFCELIAQRINSETLSNRDARSVLSKIQHIERAWRNAHNFATSETGAGIQEEDGETAFKEIVSKKCPFYYDLIDIMSDRASSEPKLTSYQLDDDDEEKRNESEEDDLSALSDDDGGVTSKSVASKSIASKSTRRGTDSTAPSTSSSRKKKQRRSRLKTPLMDAETLTLLGDTKKANEDRMQEMARHNKAMESMEQQKFALEKQKVESMSWKGKSDQLEYKMNLLSRYEQLKEDKNWSDEQIIQFFPDMKEVIAAKNHDANSDSD